MNKFLNQQLTYTFKLWQWWVIIFIFLILEDFVDGVWAGIF